ncbi:hypothetical protein [Streptomyces cremeus]|uniref:Secreted protein n=1 Tax=Streptomyces cremeus TaxID=66881 RepID=A0ABV5PFY8_STRCM
MQHLRAHSARPAAVVLSALFALLTLLSPASATSASRPTSAGAVAATARAQAWATADAQRPHTVVRPAPGHGDAVPYPPPPCPGPGAGAAAPHRAVGGPAVAVTAAAVTAGRDVSAHLPRGPPSRRSTEVLIDV